MIRWSRHLLVTATILGLLASNVLTLTNAAFNAALSGALASATGVRTVSGMLQDRITSKDKALRQQQKSQAQRKAAVRKFGTRLTDRTRRVAAKSLAAVPAESIPVIGIGVLIAETGYELYAACETLRDVNQLYIDLGVDAAGADDGLHEVCTVLQ